MKYWRKTLFLAVIISLLLPVVSACSDGSDIDSRLREITGDERFSLVGFEVDAVVKQIAGIFSSDTVAADSADIVKDYLAGDHQDEESREQAEKVIEAQVREAYHEFGIYNPLDDRIKIELTFPPVNIYLGDPPRLLVVSPRDVITRYREVLLLPDISVEDMEEIESRVEELGYSACVVGLGGVATYPSYVTANADIRFILDTAAEEWLHQYLAFTPLGFNYVLDILKIKPDYEIARMNETVAGIVAKEIGAAVYERYYREEPDAVATPEPPPATTFDFNAAMRETRRHVDELLANGEIDRAEQYMEERREYILDNGYYIRKLNQAYFAFHGTYAASGTSIDPIGDEFAELRALSDSLSDFLHTAAGLTSEEELQQLLP